MPFWRMILTAVAALEAWRPDRSRPVACR
jgi:hypothetical protein